MDSMGGAKPEGARAIPDSVALAGAGGAGCLGQWVCFFIFFHFFTVSWVPKAKRCHSCIRQRACWPLGSSKVKTRDETDPGRYDKGECTHKGSCMTQRSL